MKLAVILEAMSALVEARRALRIGGSSISEQMRIGNRCQEAEIALQLGLERDFPEVKIDRTESDDPPMTFDDEQKAARALWGFPGLRDRINGRKS